MALVKFAPAILAAECWRLGEQVKEAEQAGSDRFSIDVIMGMTVFAGIAEFERALICERTPEEREVTKRHGMCFRFGRPTKMNIEQKDLTARVLAEGKSLKEVTKTFSLNLPK